MEINSFNSTYRKKVAVLQTSVEQKIDAKQTNIGKIICVNATSCLDNIELLNGEAYYNGVVTFDCLYTDEQGNLLTSQSTADFNGKYTDETINANMTPIYKVETINVTISNAKNDGFMVNATLEITLDAFVDDVVSPYENTSENIRTKKETVEVMNLKNTGSSSFVVNEDFDVKGANVNVLFKNACVMVKDVKAGTGYFTVEGDIKLDLCYEVGDDENKIVRCNTNCLPFKEEIEVDGMTKNDYVDIMTCVPSEDIAVNVTSSEETKTSLNANINVKVKYFTLSQNEREITVDAYSLTNNLNLVSESFKYSKSVQNICESKNIDCELSLQDDQKRISKILFVCGENVNVTNSYVSEEKLAVEGIVSATVVYLADDDNEEICSAVVENPFKIEVAEELNETDHIFVKTCIKECSSHAKRGKEVELEFELMIEANIYDEQDGSYIKDVEVAEEYQKSPYSLQIFFAEADADSWQIGKQLHCDSEEIEKQNPDLKFPLSKPEQIVYFIQK